MKRGIFLFVFLGVLFCAGVTLGRIGGGDIGFKPHKEKPVTFSHDFHVKDAGIACQKCHPSPYITPEKDPRATMAAMRQGKSCGACHNGKEAFSVSGKDQCTKCHKS